TLGLLDAPLHDLPVLVVRQRRALTRGAHRNETAGAFGNLPVHQAAEGFLVKRAVAERSDERGKRAPEARPDGHDTILWVQSAPSEGPKPTVRLRKPTAWPVRGPRPQPAALLPGTPARRKPPATKPPPFRRGPAQCSGS